jgi:quinolinate synthase
MHVSNCSLTNQIQAKRGGKIGFEIESKKGLCSQMKMNTSSNILVFKS